MRRQAQIALYLVEPQRLHDTERVALAVEGLSLQRVVEPAERHHARLGAEGPEEIRGDLAARGADLQPGEIFGALDRPRAGGDVVEPVLPGAREGVEPRLGELMPDHGAKFAVECGEDRNRVAEGKG